MPKRKKDNPTVKTYRKTQDFDPEYDVHIIDGSREAVALYGVVPLKAGQEATVLCLDATNTVTINTPAGVVMGGTSDVLTFSTGDSVIMRAISLTSWLIMVNNGVVAN